MDFRRRISASCKVVKLKLGKFLLPVFQMNSTSPGKHLYRQKFSLWISAADVPPDDNSRNSRCVPFQIAFKFVVLLLTRWPVACHWHDCGGPSKIGISQSSHHVRKAAPQWCARSSSVTQTSDK